MATEVKLPALGESVTEGTVTQWLKSVGDEVAVDEALLEVSTDKVDTEIPSPVAGTLLEIRADEDLAENAGSRRRDLGVDLVGRHLEQRLVDLDAVTLLLEPPGDGALGDALAQPRHGYRYRHGVLLLSVVVAGCGP